MRSNLVLAKVPGLLRGFRLGLGKVRSRVQDAALSARYGETDVSSSQGGGVGHES